MKRLLFFLSFIGVFTMLYSQTTLVFVYFKDKPNKAVFYANPLSELSQKSLNRRTNLNINLNDQDVPIEQSYIVNIQNLGFAVTDYSKWLNGVAVYATPTQVSLLQSQNFVQSVESFAKNPNPSSKVVTENKWNEFQKNIQTNFNYGAGLDQINQINLRNLHVMGYTGSGVTIAVLDTGFPNVDTGATFTRLWSNNQIKGGYNFVNKNTDIYNTTLANHGTFVLGNIGGYIDGNFAGSAPDADFYLYATEKTPQEIPEEQLYWIEAAEEADRKGVDIITTSLGYSTFDDPQYNLQYSDMNGTTAFISRGAQIATEKGIFVLAAAGNSALQSWHYITAPADNTIVFSIGAVDSTGASSAFSSFGPNSLGFIKPDASARGTAATTVNGSTTMSASGTSFAAPIAAGGMACLLQAFPNMNREFIRNKLRQTASLYPSYTDQMGYGILNFGATINMLNTFEISKDYSFSVYPNPTKDWIMIQSKKTPTQIEVFDQLGRKLLSKKNDRKIDIQHLAIGIYYLKIQFENHIEIEKIIKQ